jgi:hypothetical protein
LGNRFVPVAGVVFVAVLLNTQPLLSLTQNLFWAYFVINILGFLGLTYAPLIMLINHQIDIGRCSNLFKNISIGFALGSLSILAVNIASGSLLNPSFALQILLGTVLAVFCTGYNATFSALFWDVDRKLATNEVETKPDLIAQKGFRIRLKITNWFTIPLIIGLIVYSEYFFASTILVFQIVTVIIALRVKQFAANLDRKKYPHPSPRL